MPTPMAGSVCGFSKRPSALKLTQGSRTDPSLPRKISPVQCSVQLWDMKEGKEGSAINRRAEATWPETVHLCDGGKLTFSSA